jgi:hypothetical protein
VIHIVDGEVCPRTARRLLDRDAAVDARRSRLVAARDGGDRDRTA